MLSQNLKAALLSVSIAVGFAADARALSVLPIHDANHYNDTAWDIVEIGGHIIAPDRPVA